MLKYSCMNINFQNGTHHIIYLRIENLFWSFDEGINGINDVHIVWRLSFDEGMNGITDVHIVWRA